MTKLNIELGQKVKCKITGFTGIAISREEYLNGCVQITVKPKVNSKGENQDAICIDIEQLEVIGGKTKTVKTNTGGPKEKAKNFYAKPRD